MATAKIPEIRVKNGIKHPTYSPRVCATKAKNARTIIHIIT